AEQEAAASRSRIVGDRDTLAQTIAALKKRNQQLTTAVDDLTERSGALAETEQALSRQLAETDSMVREMVGVVRVNAKDLEGLILQSPQTALNDPDLALLRDIADQAHFPGMADIRRMADMVDDYIRRSGQVRRTRGPIVDRGGHESTAEILVIGNFTTAYRAADEVGFLSYSADRQKLFALSRLPAGRMQKQIAHYLDGRSEAVPMDISRGGALRQLTHQLSLWQQIPKGGPIVVPILLILAAGLLIVAERTFFLWRQRLDAEGLMGRLDDLAREGQWEACRTLCAAHAGKPVARVVEAGLRFRHMAREEMENALQEAILKEVPPMERLLSTLGMLAAIAPLLGLLGTVTGMIGTFHVITLHGTGDPRLMSGGISEALVTTMLGLSVAIPIMLAHTLLSRGVDNMVGTMEEKAVALVNIVHKYRTA
ncbi:MAG: MotA/TolQ/ExbB proton channel family protein, partial [Desulfatitalea sp.]|nr:MotA/TolQ/ExbB proton channel family protein [Desulfatitalea sp.]